MAFVTGSTSALQSAVKAAADIVSSEIGAGLLSDQSAIDARFAEIRDREFGLIKAQVEADNVLFAANDDGGKRGKGGGSAPAKRAPSLDEARDTVLNFGAFKTLTLGEVFDMSAEEAEGYGYADKDEDGNVIPGTGKPGRQWVAWAAKNQDKKASFIRQRAELLINAARAESDAA